jgi:membrane AbrB-like protein
MSDSFGAEALRKLALTLAVGLAGGAAFFGLGLPVPWLSGPAVTVACVSIAGVNLSIPHWLRDAAFVFLGATMGTAVTPDTLAQVTHWPMSLAGLAVCVFCTMNAISIYLERIHRYDRATARLSAVPGALPYVLALATQSSGDQRRIAVIQMVRLAALLIFLPSVLTLLGVKSPAASATASSPGAVRVHELVILMTCGALGAWIFAWFRAPAAALFGSMVASALLYGSGAISSSLPLWLSQPGLVVIGSVVGSNFAGVNRRLLLDTLLASAGSVLIGAAAALVCALPVAWLVGVPPAQLWLAYAPGGVETMAIMALALGLDPAFVGGHHLARFFGLGVFVPVWLRAHLKTNPPSSSNARTS